MCIKYFFLKIDRKILTYNYFYKCNNLTCTTLDNVLRLSFCNLRFNT